MLIFHHIPKTAGTSFVHLLRSNYPGEELFLSHEDKDNPSLWWREWWRSLTEERRRGLQCVASHTANRLIPVLIEEGAPFIALTLLRDPVERCISLYYFVLELARDGEQQAGGRAGRFLLENQWSLDDIYLHAEDPGTAPLLSGFFNGQARSLFRPFGVTFDHSRQPVPAEQLEPAMQHYDAGLVEQYRQTIDRWAARLSWRQVGYEATNITRSRRDAPPISSETRSLIRSYNQIDWWLHERARTDPRPESFTPRAR